MRLLHIVLIVLAAAAALAAGPASAQLSNHGIAVESGISSPIGKGGAPSATFALTASAWLEGDLEAVARVSYRSAPETAGRGAASAVTGTAGLRLSLGHGPVRPQVFLDAGWARLEAGGAVASGGALGIGAALEWFPASDFSVAPRIAFRLAGGDPSLEVMLALGGYF
jgi:hypothetical protein